MEKLIELLTQYKPQADFIYMSGGIRKEIPWNKDVIMTKDLLIISKQFGFIKRLVDNDKIDLEKVEKKFYNEICITDYGDKDRAYGKSDLVISVLSISENPIEDLLLYLK